MIAVLCAMPDSIYGTLPACDVYDKARDARSFPGGVPVVAHPPCAQWSRMRAFARRDDAERDLAPWCIDQVRRFGGVLEHPASTRLWSHCSLPPVGCLDAYGGFTMVLDQFCFGHPAQKRTLLYIVGVKPSDLPAWPLAIGEADAVACTTTKNKHSTKRRLTKRERIATPAAFALWLVEIARRATA